MLPLVSLETAKKPADIPQWITQKYLEQSAANQKLQKKWQPKCGDWFFCLECNAVMRVANPQSYDLGGQVNITYEYERDAVGRWTCDIYLPDPTE